MKKLFVLCVCVLALLGQPVSSWAADPEVVIVQLMPAGNGKARVSIARAGAKTEVQEFSNNIEERAEVQQKLFQQLYQQGFTIQSTYTTTNGATTIVLVKGVKS